MNNIDCKLLNRQKQELIEVADNGHPNLHGIVHLLDALQDDAVDNKGLPEEEVFEFKSMTSKKLTVEDMEERFGIQASHQPPAFQVEIEGEDVHWLDTATVEITMLRVYWKILHAMKMAHDKPLFDVISMELAVALDNRANKILHLS